MNVYECPICHGVFRDPQFLYWEQLGIGGYSELHYEMRCPLCRTLLVHTNDLDTFKVKLHRYEVVNVE